jgi:hypothetical protein
MMEYPMLVYLPMRYLLARPLRAKPSSKPENRLRGKRGSLTNFPRVTSGLLGFPKLQPRNGDGRARLQSLLRRQESGGKKTPRLMW